ncbi:MAG TPA: SRPBCC family protein [Candidatus Nanopelagicaceae bacterium]|nr:SRPBCC family protein [Candidatus Nanopelagicaceae bacterium]
MIKKKSIEQELKIKSSPHEIYEVFMDSKKHSKLTESKAKVSRVVGGSFSIFEGSLSGKNVELIQDKKIVQTWRGDGENWPKGYYSTITLILEPVDQGTLITFTHVDIPEASYESVKEGWDTYYWEPLKEMLEK